MAVFREDQFFSWAKDDRVVRNGGGGGSPGKVAVAEWEDAASSSAGEGDAKPGARYTEAELQQSLMAARREHKEGTEQLRKEQDEALFKLRGEQVIWQQFLWGKTIFLLSLFFRPFYRSTTWRRSSGWRRS